MGRGKSAADEEKGENDEEVDASTATSRSGTILKLYIRWHVGGVHRCGCVPSKVALELVAKRVCPEKKGTKPSEGKVLAGLVNTSLLTLA
jgi:hypothetical protein